MNLMYAIKLIVRELIVDRVRLWRATSVAARYAVVGLSLAGSQLIAAQEPDASGQTNDAPAAQVLSQLDDLMRGGDGAQAEDTAPGIEVPEERRELPPAGDGRALQ